MHLIRRAAIRSLQAQTISSPSRSFASRSKSLVQSQRSSPAITWPTRRFYSDDKSIESETNNASSDNADKPVVDTVVDAANAAADAATSVAASAAESLGLRDTSSGAREAPKPSRILYVGNLFFELTPERLRETFEKVGTVTNARIVTDQNGMSKGFGYIEFEDVEKAEQAIREFDQVMLDGRRMAVQFHISRSKPQDKPIKRNPPSRTLFIGNVPFDMSDNDMNELFRQFKNLQDVRVAIDRKTGQSRGFCHADFTDIASAVAARKDLEGKIFGGRPLRIDYGLPSSLSRPRGV